MENGEQFDRALSDLMKEGQRIEFNSSRKGRALGPTQKAKARYGMTDPKKDACEPIDNKRGQSKQSREAERQRVVEEYVMDLRKILKKLRKLFN